MRCGTSYVAILTLGAAGLAGAAALSPPFGAALAAPAFSSDKPLGRADGGPEPGRAARDPGCLYGKVLDGHTGGIRCLSPQEVAPAGPGDINAPSDAGAYAPMDASAEPSRRRDAGGLDVVLADAAIPLRAASAVLQAVDFQDGDVPRARAALERLARRELTRCVADHDVRFDRRRAASDPYVELRFLVRAPGRAEGVDVSGARGVSGALVQCARTALANRAVGAPSSEPVAVTVRFGFR